MAPVGTSFSRLIVLRGNSASGKSAAALGLRQRFGRGLAIVGQDNIRRDILQERDRPGGANIDLIDLTARFALERGFQVIVEGIMNRVRYGEMLARLCADHRGKTSCFYFDVSFEETLRRHQSKPQAGEYGEAEMRQWFHPHDLLLDLQETIIPESFSLDEAIELIWNESGLIEAAR